MAKKSKVGKQRKDKFYHLAKDAGFRSRAAFKLLQLNRKYEFLGRSRVLVDLCAAPGGWLQVAQKYMPVSSVIVGVDLVPIKPIPNVVTITEDITTDKCRQQLKRELKTWKADVVLHDGAPNVGKSWLHDAFAQAQLTLHAFKLACELLVKGGWFITKVFRSKDYNALLWSFNQLFKKVHATKPQASRNESAEIFVICQHFLAPDKIDPKFFDISHVFKDNEGEAKPRLKLFGKEKSKVKAEGYPEGDHTLYHRVPVSEFISSNNHMEILASCTEIVIDSDEIKNHKLTTQEILECCKDVKVLGRKELKDLLQWKRLLKKEFDKENQSENACSQTEKAVEVKAMQNEEECEKEDENTEANTNDRRKKRKLLKEKRRQQNKLDLQMVIKDDVPIVEEDIELFRLSKIRTNKDVREIEEQPPDVTDTNNEDPLLEDEVNPRKKKYATYTKDEQIGDWCTEYTAAALSDDDDDHSEGEEDEKFSSKSSESSDEFEDTDDPNPLLVDLDYKGTSRKQRANLWFEKKSFKSSLNKDDDEELEIDMLADVQEKIKANRSKQLEMDISHQVYKSDTESESSDSSSDDEVEKVPKTKKKKIRLDPEGLALGTLMVQSSKSKRDIIDHAHNRYTFNDGNLPDWFVKDEAKHNRPTLPVTPQMIQEYKERLKEINDRPIKKVAEAKARKKKRALRKMEKARKRAEAITENMDMTDHEKAQHIKNIYKKALKNEDKKVTYVFPKKGIGKRVRRPPGVKGKFKVVDRRMKKDDRKRKIQEKTQKNNGSSRRKKRSGR